MAPYLAARDSFEPARGDAGNLEATRRFRVHNTRYSGAL